MFHLPLLPLASVCIDYMIPYFIVIPVEREKLSQNRFKIHYSHGTYSCRLIYRRKFVVHLQEKNYKNRNHISVELKLYGSQLIQRDLPNSHECY